MDNNHLNYRQSPLPTAVLAHYLRQIQAHHCRTPGRSPLPLHYDAVTQTLKEFAWPFDAETGQRVPPSMLESYRRTHYFRGPSCLCAFLDNKDYTESLIGIVEVARGDADGNHDSVMNGQYVAVCERRRCGYSLCLEKFYMLSGIKVRPCTKRETPLHPQELNYISDLQGPSPAGGRASLTQVINEPTIRGRSRRQFTLVKPEVPKKAKQALMHSLVHGMDENLFWDTFVQCFECKDITRPSMARSTTRFAPPASTPLGRSRTRARIGRILGDAPETRRMTSMSTRSSSLAPTEVLSEPETQALENVELRGGAGPSRFQGAWESDSESDEDGTSDAELPSVLDLFRKDE